MKEKLVPGGAFRMAADLTVSRLGYGAMQLAGPHVFGPPADRAAAIAVLREAVEPWHHAHRHKRLLRPARHESRSSGGTSPLSCRPNIVTKVGARRDERGGWPPALTPAELRSAVQDNLRNLGLDVLDIVNLRVGGMDRPSRIDRRSNSAR